MSYERTPTLASPSKNPIYGRPRTLIIVLKSVARKHKKESRSGGDFLSRLLRQASG